LVASVLSAGASRSAAAECRAPRFRLVKDFIHYESGRGAARVTLAPADFALTNLLCLAQALKVQHPDWKEVNVLMFSSEVAAASFSPGKMGPPELWQFDRQLRAFYSLNVSTHEEFLAITPMGLEGGEASDTRIMLPASGTPHCRLEIHDRCLFALDQFMDVADRLRTSGSGSVTLAGTIGRDGKVTGLKTADAGSDRPSDAGSLARSASDNLATWWLEPAPREDPIRITYAYVVDSTLPKGKVDVQFALPDRVTIRANPAQ
jgi:hypothetical protein